MADTAIASLPELQVRLEWDLDSGEQAIAQGALEDLSDDARFYGSQRWDSETAPRQVKSLVLRAAVRYMRNPEGFVQSRAGDETVIWSDKGEDAGTAHFTEREQKILGAIAGRGQGLTSVNTFAWAPGTRTRPRRIDPSTASTGSDYGADFYGDTDSGRPIPMQAGDEF